MVWYVGETGSRGTPLNGVHLLGARGNKVPTQPDCSGVSQFFDEVEKLRNSTRMGWHAPACHSFAVECVREAGSLTHSQVPPVEGVLER
jgi:hypothetical protein